MTKFAGRLGTVGLAVESTRGTPVNPTYWLPNVTVSFFDRTETAREEQGLGVLADSDSLYVTMRMGEGEIESQLYDQALGYILTSLLGAVPSSSGVNPYTHAFTLTNANQQKSLSIYWKDPNTSIMFPLAVVDSLEVTVEPNGIVEYTVGFKSKGSRDWTSQTPSFTTLGSKFLHQHLEFKLAANIAGIAAATKLSLKGLELTISRNTVFDSVMGTVEPEDILAQQTSVEGNITLNNEDTTYRDYMINGTYRAMEIKFNRSASSSLTLQLPRVDFTEWEPDYSLNEISKQTINFKGNYDAANALDIISTASLINTKASY